MNTEFGGGIDYDYQSNSITTWEMVGIVNISRYVAF